jgi:hypothetical protein
VKGVGMIFEGIGFSVFLTTVILAIVLFPDYLPRHRQKLDDPPLRDSIIGARDRSLSRLLVRTWKWGLYGGGILMLLGAGMQRL